MVTTTTAGMLKTEVINQPLPVALRRLNLPAMASQSIGRRFSAGDLTRTADRFGEIKTSEPVQVQSRNRIPAITARNQDRHIPGSRQVPKFLKASKVAGTGLMKVGKNVCVGMARILAEGSKKTVSSYRRSRAAFE